MISNIQDQYKAIGKTTKLNALSPELNKMFLDLHLSNLSILSHQAKTPLVSKIPGKEYFSFDNGKKKSRAVNEALFTTDLDIVRATIDAISTKNFEHITSADITKALYSMAISFCSVIDLNKTNDQKTPGTFFEYFCCNWISKTLGVHPSTEIDVLRMDGNMKLTTDFTYNLGPNKPKIHLPVKTSTRERVIQVWAHQRVLDGVYGVGQFLGILSCLSETKVDQKTLEVVEICLPDQWQIYQLFIAQMKRVYYLDLPTRYEGLNEVYPPISVKPLGDFFFEYEELFNMKRPTDR